MAMCGRSRLIGAACMRLPRHLTRPARAHPLRRRGGGVVHGPVPRSHAHDLPKRVRRLGLQCALSAKVWERRLVLVESLQPAEPKTVRSSACHATGRLLASPACRVRCACTNRPAPPESAPAFRLLYVPCRAESPVAHSPSLRLLQKAALAAVDSLLADAPRRSALLCDSSKTGEDGG